jgi:ankyrin repeat protein
MRAGVKASAVVAALLSIAALTGCAQTPTTATTAPESVDAAASNAAPALTPQDRLAFFVNHARQGEYAEVDREIAAGIDVNGRDTLDQTALIAAVTHRSEDIVALLLAHHADPNLADNAGWTPLIYGAYFGVESSLLQRLVDSGADINARNDRGITALYLASATGHEAQVQFLLDHGADRTLASTAGYTPLRVAQLKGLGKIVALLDPAPASAGSAASKSR